MHLLDTLVGVVATVAVVLLARPLGERTGVNSALLLTVLGIAASYLPFVHIEEMDPEFVLLGVLPPILYAAAINVSLPDLKAELRPIIRLSVGLVIFTAFAVGLVGWWLLPVGFAAALALGAVVAPPDAVAAMAIGRKLGLPRRIMTLLEGESLLNDATALVLLSTAIAAISAGTTPGEIGLGFLLSVGGGLAVGIAVALLVNTIHRLTSDSTISTGLSLITPWLAFIPAEEIHASGVFAVVVAGLIIGHKAPVLQSATARLTQTINWRTISFLLENAVFFLIGLQARQILESVHSAGHSGWDVWGAVVAIYLTVVAARFLWVFGSSLPVFGRGRGHQRLSWQQSFVLSFAGMRGVVTLASVFLIPAETPYRDVLVLAALVVTVASLLVQGLTMPYFVRRLGVVGAGVRSEILQEAHIMQRLAVTGRKTVESLALAEGRPASDTDRSVLERLETMNALQANRVWERLGRQDDGEAPSHMYRRYRLEMIQAQRAEALAMRNERSVDYEVLQKVLSSLDVEEAGLQAAEESARLAPESDGQVMASRCIHLEDTDGWEPIPLSDFCEDCLAEGLTPVHLRLCMQCGYVGCCDSSPGRHMTKHFHETGHPVIRSFEPGEAWRWCNVDHLLS